MAVILSFKQENRVVLSAALALVALAGIAVGIWLIVRSYAPEQAVQMDAVRISAQEWQTTYRPQLAASTFIAQAGDDSALHLNQSTDDPPLNSATPIQYLPLHFVLPESSASSLISPTNYSTAVVTTFVIRAKYVSSNGTRVSNISVSSPLFSRSIIRIAKSPAQAKLDFSLGASGWYLDETQGDGGCPDGKGAWNKFSYEQISVAKAALYNIATGVSEVSFSDFTLTVRSAADPTLNAPSAAPSPELSSANLRIIGFVAIGLSLVICINPLLCVLKLKKLCDDDKRREQELEFTDITIGSSQGGGSGGALESPPPDHEWTDAELQAAHAFARNDRQRKYGVVTGTAPQPDEDVSDLVQEFHLSPRQGVRLARFDSDE